MTKIQVRKVNGVPMGRPKNPFAKHSPKYHEERNTLNRYEMFEQSVTEHEAPGCEEGEAEGVLVWQDRLKYECCDEPSDYIWTNCDPPPITRLSTFDYRQIWIVPTPEKVEVKEVEVSLLRVLRYGICG